MTFVWSSPISHCSHPTIEGHQISHTLFALSKAKLDCLRSPHCMCCNIASMRMCSMISQNTDVWGSVVFIFSDLCFSSFSVGVMFPFSSSPGTSPDFENYHEFSKIMHVVCLCYCRMSGTGTVQSANWNFSDGVWASWGASRYFDCFSCTAFLYTEAEEVKRKYWNIYTLETFY